MTARSWWKKPCRRRAKSNAVCLGNDDPIASVPGEIKPGREFYDYEAKYFDEHTQLIIPAPMLDELTARVRELAVRAFRAVDCAGMARVDFLLSARDRRVVRE